MMKKIYNIILILLLVAALTIGILIFIKYYNNYLNEKNIIDAINQIEWDFQKLSKDKVVETSYEGYNVEGIIEIPKINIKYPIIHETNDQTMKLSITKFCGPAINEIGNYVMAGHNNIDGTMFGKTKYLKIGDIIKITSLKNETIEYEIFKIYSTDPDDVSVVESIESETREITLITCTNGRKQRLIVKAREI